MGFQRGGNRGGGGGSRGGGGRGRSSFGSDRGGGGRGRGSFGRGRGGGGGRGGGFGGGNRSLNSSGNRSFGSDNGGERKSFGGGGRGDRNSFGNRGGGGRGGFFKRGGGDGPRGGGFQNGKGSKSFQDDRKRKYESDSDDDEITEKPKSILKTPRLDIKSDKKKVTMKPGALQNSFQPKTPATPHPIKNKPSISTPHAPKEIDFNESDDDEELDEEMTGIEGMDFEDSDAEDLDSDAEDMESFEDMDDASDLEEVSDLAHLGGAEDSLSGDGIGIEEIESEDEDSDDEPVAKQKKPVAEKPAKTEKQSKVSNGDESKPASSSAKQLENARKIELYKTALYVAKPGEALERKTLLTCHPFLIGAWKAVNEGLLLIFDSEKSRNKALQWFQSAQDADYKTFNPSKAEEIKALLEDTTKDVDYTKLHFSHVPERIAKRHFKILFPDSESIDCSLCTDVVVGFKSAQEAQKALDGLGNCRLFGSPVLVKFHRASAKKSEAITPVKKAKAANDVNKKSS